MAHEPGLHEAVVTSLVMLQQCRRIFKELRVGEQPVTNIIGKLLRLCCHSVDVCHKFAIPAFIVPLNRAINYQISFSNSAATDGSSGEVLKKDILTPIKLLSPALPLFVST
jgi:hypothetical protein